MRRRLKAPTLLPTLLQDGFSAESPEDKGRLLVRQYSSVYVEDTDYTEPVSDSTTPNSDGFMITTDEVLRELNNLNTTKSPGPDGLHPMILKNLAEVIAEPLCCIYNSTLLNGKLPSDWKKAIISPRFKGGDRKKPESYRPISLTCISCKVLEKIITRRMHDYLDRYNLLTPTQHGFRRNRSCVTNLLYARESWTDTVAKGSQVDAIFIDFSKAFDKVPHSKLVSKLSTFKLPAIFIRWIQDFLANRSFAVRVEHITSEELPMLSGVPQGSVLGPLLFLLYVNDLPGDIKSDCLFYADDLKIWRPVESANDVTILQQDLDVVLNWSKSWKLPISYEKRIYLNIDRRRQAHSYYLDGLEVTHNETVPDLGITVTSDLKTLRHTEKACCSARRTLGAIRRTFSRIPKQTFQHLFAAHVRPRLEYGGSATFPCLAGELNQLELVQRSATRLVHELKHETYEDRLAALNLFPQVYRRTRGDLITIRRILRGEFGEELLKFFPVKADCRRGHLLTVSKQRPGELPAIFRLSRRVINLWNSLPAQMAEEENEDRFKKEIDAHLHNMWHREWH